MVQQAWWVLPLPTADSGLMPSISSGPWLWPQNKKEIALMW